MLLFRLSPALLLILLLLPRGWAAEPPVFPLKVSAGHRCLTDQNDTPFLYQADTAWMVFFKLTEQEASDYFKARKAQGFNVIQAQLTGFLEATTANGDRPFAPPDFDFSAPEESYFAHVDRVVAEAGKQGLAMAMTPAWSGCCQEGWAGRTKSGQPAPLNTNGPEKSRALGKWIGSRYGKYPHVMWIMGGDNDPDNAREEIRQLARGIKEAAPTQLITYHASSSHSSTQVWPADESWLDVSMVYTYFRGFNKAWNQNQPDVYEVSHREYAQIPIRPFLLGESTYEGEHGDWGSALQVRKQAYWCLLSGGCGHAYGSPNWNFPPDWRKVLELPGANSLKHLRTLFESRPWWKLVPDIGNSLAVDGRGSFATNGCAVTALSGDGSFAFSYLPFKRTLTLDLARLSGERVIASWFNPRTGVMSRIGGFTGRKRQAFEPPGDGDWVLVVENGVKTP